MVDLVMFGRLCFFDVVLLLRRRYHALIPSFLSWSYLLAVRPLYGP